MKKTILTAITLLLVASISLTSCDLSKTVYYDDGPEYDTEPPIDFDYYYSLLPGYHSMDPETQKSTGIVLPWEDVTFDAEYLGKTGLHCLAITDPELFEELKGTMFVMPYKSSPIITEDEYLIPSHFIVVSPSVQRIEFCGLNARAFGDGTMTYILPDSIKYLGDNSLCFSRSTSNAIYYEGTIEQFMNIEKVDEHNGNDWKRWLIADVSVYCLDGKIEYRIAGGPTSKTSYITYTIVK